MRRRDFLVTGTALAALAGCVGHTNPGGGRGVPGGDTPTSPGTTPDGEWPCPSFVGADRTVCFSRRSSADVYLQPSTQEFQEFEGNDERETMTVTLRNESDRPFLTNPYDWAVYHQSAEGWTHLAPEGPIAEPLLEVPAGETHEWVLATLFEPSSGENRRGVRTDLQSGDRHAFAIHGWRGDTEGTHVECVAVFDYVRAVPRVER